MFAFHRQQAQNYHNFSTISSEFLEPSYSCGRQIIASTRPVVQSVKCKVVQTTVYHSLGNFWCKNFRYFLQAQKSNAWNLFNPLQKFRWWSILQNFNATKSFAQNIFNTEISQTTVHIWMLYRIVGKLAGANFHKLQKQVENFATQIFTTFTFANVVESWPHPLISLLCSAEYWAM